MDIALINPPEIKFHGYKPSMCPLGLAMIAGVLEKNGYSVKIIDGQLDNLSVRALQSKLIDLKPEIVGITGTTWNRFDSFETANTAKKTLPTSAVVYGGPHATFAAADTLKNISSIDVIVRGEGEVTFLELVRAIEAKTGFENITGISYRKEGKIFHNGDRPLIENMDTLPWPARHLIDMKKYNNSLFGIPAITVITARGCPMKCVFCSAGAMWGNKYRYRTTENVVDEIEYLKREYGIKAIWFFDDTLTLNRKHIDRLIREFNRRRLDITWYCGIRLDTVDRELLRNMREAGCIHVSFGVESGSQKVLDRINKRINLSQLDNVAKWTKEFGICAKAFFMFGLPEETYEDAKKTVELIKKYKGIVDIIAISGGTSIHPGTEVERFARQNGYLPDDFSWSEPFYEYQNPTIGRDPRLPTLIQPQMGFKELRELNFEVSRKQRFTFIRMLNRFKKYRKFVEIKKDLKLVSSFLIWLIKKFKIKKSKLKIAVKDSLIYPANIRFPMERANAIQIIHTCHALASKGVEVYLLVRKMDNRTTEECLGFYGLKPHANLHIIRLPVLNIHIHFIWGYSFYLLCFLTIFFLRVFKNIRIIYLREIGVTRYLLLVKSLLRCKLLYEAHSLESMEQKEMQKLLSGGVTPDKNRLGKILKRETKILINVDGLIVTSNSLKHTMQKYLGISRTATIIPNGVTIPEKPSIHFFKKQHSRSLIYTGQLYPWKGVDVLIKALREIPDAMLTIVGGLSYEKDIYRLKRLVKKITIEDRVQFIGFIPHRDIKKYLEEADIGVIPLADNVTSRYFTSPLKMFEYMAAGLPIIASDLPTIREVLIDHENAVLVKPGDPKDLAHGIRELLDNRELANKLSQKAYEDVKQCSWDMRAEKIIKVLENK